MDHRVALFVISMCLIYAVQSQELYSDKYDNFDVDSVLANDAVRERYYDCFMDKGPCDEDAAYFKNNFPETFVTNCKKCTDWQKAAFDKISAWYSQHKEDAWNAFVDKMLQDAKNRNITPA